MAEATPVKISGTKEWAVKNINCARGCEHNCRYCYARFNALRFELIDDPEKWETPVINEKAVNKGYRKAKGRIMFPTTHDITPLTLEPSVTVLGKLLKSGNEVLVVSKPHYECITRLLAEFLEYKDQLIFRFTIGAMDDDVLGYWEPGAPKFSERAKCLMRAYEYGFKTSVSAEPMMDSENIGKLFYALKPFITDSLWIGKMNRIRQRVKVETDEDKARVATIEAGQTDERIRVIYKELKDEPLVRWKESFKEVLGLELPTEAGLDV